MENVKVYLLIVFAICCEQVTAQELFVFTEPASNMPAHSVAAKLTARYPAANGATATFRQRYMPEIMAGVSKQLMLHGSMTFSDLYSDHLRWESAKVYAKWRFYSDDDIHRHFRMAAYAEGAYTRNPFLYDELNLEGDHSGIQGGLIVTQLLNRLALSATAGATRVFTGSMAHALPGSTGLQVLNYTLSSGYLLLPRRYTSYSQTNINLYMEMIGMSGLGRSGYMVDLAPALQVIVNSNLKLNAGYRFQVAGNMLRISENNWVIGVERTFLGALPRRKKK